MPNKAILIGNVNYQRSSNLPCCANDVAAMRELLEATGKFDEIELIEDLEADELRERVRAAAGRGAPTGELFFYFTGHGHEHDGQFYYCATNFDSKRPNETGLSAADLDTLLRLAEADLVVKVIDACHAGTRLIKTGEPFFRSSKDGFKDIIQIASCLDNQVSLPGDPLSVFTERFINAALGQDDGVVYYMNIINRLKDDSLNDHEQTPYFIQQGTGREQFVDDAKRLDALRTRLRENKPAPDEPQALPAAPVALSLMEMLVAAESLIATPEIIKSFSAKLFDDLKAKLSTKEFADLFDTDVVEHNDFKEMTTREFIIRVMSKETRNDNFVTAEIKRERKRRRPWESVFDMLGYDDDFVERYDLSLNSKMERVQLKVTLTPKFASLKRLQLVVTCAPSLETCYVFELGTQHALNDFGEFNVEGNEFARRWYKFAWRENTDGIVNKIATKLSEAVRAHVDATAARLKQD